MTSTETTAPRVIREQEIGLRLPNGTVVYPPETWHDHPLRTAEDREVVVGLIRAAAQRLGYPEDHFLVDYGWATRELTAVVSYEQGEELPITATGHIADISDCSLGDTGIGDNGAFWDDGVPVPEETLSNAGPVD